MTQIKLCPPLDSYLDTPQADYLRGLMKRYTVDNLVGISAEDFQAKCESMSEHWGHNHDFGTFQMKGAMGDRHISVLAAFMSEFDIPLSDLPKAFNVEILDIGCWSGGASLLFNAMEFYVRAVDNRIEHIAPLIEMNCAFDLDIPTGYSEGHYYPDLVYSAGLIYHLKDPLKHLQSCYSLLHGRGSILLESASCGARGLHAEYRGKGSGGPSGPNYFIPTAECMVKWMIDAGFKVDKATFHGKRCLAVGRKG